MAKKNPHIGSSFESWLDEEGIREEVTAAAIKAVIARQLANEMKKKKITKQRAFVKALVAAAIKGDMRVTSAIVSFCTRAFGNETEDDHPQSPAPIAVDGKQKII